MVGRSRSRHSSDDSPVKRVVVGLTPTMTAWAFSRSITLKASDTLATVVIGTEKTVMPRAGSRRADVALEYGVERAGWDIQIGNRGAVQGSIRATTQVAWRPASGSRT